MNVSVLSIVRLGLCTISRIRPEMYCRGLADMKLFTLDTPIIRVSLKWRCIYRDNQRGGLETQAKTGVGIKRGYGCGWRIRMRMRKYG